MSCWMNSQEFFDMILSKPFKMVLIKNSSGPHKHLFSSVTTYLKALLKLGQVSASLFPICRSQMALFLLIWRNLSAISSLW